MNPLLPPHVDSAADAEHVRALRTFRFQAAIFAVAGLLAIVGVQALFRRQSERLAALAHHGEPAMARVTEIQSQGGVEYVHYTYVVSGELYTWSIGQRRTQPMHPGDKLAVVYLPEDPSLNRPVASRELVSAEAAEHRGTARSFVVGVAAIVLLIAIVLLRAYRRLRRVGPAQVSAPVSAEALARALAVLFLLCALGVNFAPEVAVVHAKAFGPKPFGISVAWVVSAFELVLLWPLGRMLLPLVHMQQQAAADGAPRGRLGFLLYIVRAPTKHPELADARSTILLSLGYFSLLVAAWIVFAEQQGL